MLEFKLAQTEEEIEEVSELATEIFREFFPRIISVGQVEYMVDMFFGLDNMHENLREGYEYYFIYAGDQRVGYTAIEPQGEKLFISKVYLLESERGKGYASQAFDFIESEAAKRGLKSMYLTVNVNNTHAIDVYKYRGFDIVDEVKTDIGGGYFMHDYIMEKACSNC